MNYTKEQLDEYLHNPITEAERSLAKDILAWREIAEKLAETSDHDFRCAVHGYGVKPCDCGYKEAYAAYDKAVQS